MRKQVSPVTAEAGTGDKTQGAYSMKKTQSKTQGSFAIYRNEEFCSIAIVENFEKLFFKLKY